MSTTVTFLCHAWMPVDETELVRDVVARHRQSCTLCRGASSVYGAVEKVEAR